MPNIKKDNKLDKIMWSYKPSDEDMVAVSHCFSRGIHISPIAIKNDLQSFKIDICIHSGGKIKRNIDPNVYSVSDVIPKIYEYYNYYYNKYKNEKG